LGKNLFLQHEIKDLRWRVNYDDGTVLWEIDPVSHKEAKFSDIDLTRLVSVDLLWPIKKMEDVEISATDLRVGTLDDTPAIVTLKLFNRVSLPFYHLEVPRGAQLIMARRVQISQGKKIAVIPTKNPNQPIKIPFPVPAGGKIQIMGWQKKIGSNNVQSLVFFFPNGQIHHDWTWRQDADHLEVLMPQVKDDAKVVATVTTDANIVSEPRAGLPDPILSE
jgi:hypothetical protein